jgi:hypothetical protein
MMPLTSRQLQRTLAGAIAMERRYGLTMMCVPT